MNQRPNQQNTGQGPGYPPPPPPQQQAPWRGQEHGAHHQHYNNRSHQEYSQGGSGWQGGQEWQGQPHAGMPYGQPPQIAYSPSDKTTTLILCCVGLVSIAGLHRFLTGHVLLGVLYLLTGGFCLIGTIIDLINIAGGSYRDADGLPLKP